MNRSILHFKKLICLVLIAQLLFPQQAFTMRPVSTVQQVSRVELIRDLSIDISSKSKELTEAVGSLKKYNRSFGIIANIVRLMHQEDGDLTGISATRACLDNLGSIHQNRILDIVEEHRCKNVSIDSSVTPEMLANFLDGDTSEIYFYVAEEKESLVAAFQAYKSIEESIEYISHTNVNKEDPIITEHLKILFNSLDAPNAEIVSSCRSVLKSQQLAPSASNEVKDTFLEAFISKEKHRDLLSVHILGMFCAVPWISDKDKNIIYMRECVAAMKKAGQPLESIQNMLKNVNIIFNKCQRIKVRLDDCRNREMPLFKRLIRIIAEVSLSDTKTDRLLTFFNHVTKVNVKCSVVLNDSDVEDLISKGAFWWDDTHTTLEMPRMRPRIAVFGDTGRMREGIMVKELRSNDIQTLTDTLETLEILSNVNILSKGCSKKDSIFSAISQRSMSAISEAFFIKDMQYLPKGGNINTTFSIISDLLLKPFYSINSAEDISLIGNNLDIKIPFIFMGNSDIYKELYNSDLDSFDNPYEFLRSEGIKIEGELTAGGKNLYGKLEDGRIVVIKVVNNHGFLSYFSKEILAFRKELASLAKESEMLSLVKKHKTKLGLECDYPELLHVRQGNVFSLFRIEEIQYSDVKQGQTTLLPRGRDAAGNSLGDSFCMAYIADSQQQVYLDDPYQERYPEEYLRRNTRDLLRLAKLGLFLSNWTSMDHEIGAREYNWSYKDGAGTLPKWLVSMWYTNHRKSAPADLGHIIGLDEANGIDGINFIRKSAGNIPFSAIMIECANMWKHHDYPFKFFYEDDRERFTKFLQGIMKDYYECYSGGKPDFLDFLIDWDNLADRLMYEVGSVIRQEDGQNLDFGYGHGIFPCPELIRALFITTTFAMIEKSVRDKWQKENPDFSTAGAVQINLPICFSQSA